MRLEADVSVKLKRSALAFPGISADPPPLPKANRPRLMREKKKSGSNLAVTIENKKIENFHAL